MARGCQLPVELIDAVLEHLTDDKSVLAACCLVCKAWIHPSRRLLFVEVDLHRWNVKAFLEQLSSPVSSYVRRLRLIGPFSLLFRSQTFPRLRSLENLRSLTITCQHFYYASLGTAFNNFNTIIRLHLNGVHFVAFAHFTQIICALSHLNTLVVTNSTWSFSDPPHWTVVLPQSLRVLKTRDCDWVVILQCLRSLDQIPALHTLHVSGSYGDPGDTTLSTFLQELGPHLKELWLGPDVIQESVLNLQNPCLRTLTIQFRGLAQYPQYLPHLLSQVVSRNIEDIVIGVLLAHDVVDWNHVDEILAQPQFFKLRSFRICTNGDLSAWLIDHLPRSYARNILSIGSVSEFAIP